MSLFQMAAPLNQSHSFYKHIRTTTGNSFGMLLSRVRLRSLRPTLRRVRRSELVQADFVVVKR